MANFFFGFSYWKHPFVRPFFEEEIVFINPLFSTKHLRLALKRGLNAQSSVFIWGRKSFKEVEAYARQHGIAIYRVEDGFIRSVGLGSDLTQPYSLVVDSRGIYFDPTCESDLEHLLNTHTFTEDELLRAARLREFLVAHKLSKYNQFADRELDLPRNRKIVLVPGQVEDDASIQYGAQGMRNIELLAAARANAPDAYIIYKPHPDVLAGNRVGDVLQEEALRYCDRVVTAVSLDSVLSCCDEVHTMTSLVGFEAIMRGIRVYTYGLPFYAGWGLSVDAMKCTRRKRRLQRDELVAATLLLYPRYIDPHTKKTCEVEETIKGLMDEKIRIKHSWSYRWGQRIRNILSRRTQQIIRLFH